MNTGIISKRYAKALLAYVQETGGGERVSAQVRELLDINKAERHIRGGMATRRKYKGE